MRRLLYLLFLVPLCASADSWVGLQLGQVTDRDVCSGVNDGEFSGASIHCDDTAGMVGLLLGHRFHPNFSGELFIAGFGEESVSLVSPGATLDANARVAGVGADILAELPLTERFRVFGQAGAFRWRERVEAAGFESSIGNFRVSEDEDGTSFFWGVGGEFGLLPNVSLRVQYQRFSNIDDDAYEAITASALLHFGPD